MNKYQYLIILQGDYGHGFEDISASTRLTEIRQLRRDYQQNEGGIYRIIRRRELNK